MMTRSLMFLTCVFMFLAKSNGILCPGFCTLDSREVCGSDYRTYSNTCSLQRAHCWNPYLRKLHYGPCNEKDCPLACVSQYMPVCGNDWRTYKNACELRHIACSDSSSLLKLAHYGRCRFYGY